MQWFIDFFSGIGDFFVMIGDWISDIFNQLTSFIKIMTWAHGVSNDILLHFPGWLLPFFMSMLIASILLQILGRAHGK